MTLNYKGHTGRSIRRDTYISHHGSPYTEIGSNNSNSQIFTLSCNQFVFCL